MHIQQTKAESFFFGGGQSVDLLSLKSWQIGNVSIIRPYRMSCIDTTMCRVVCLSLSLSFGHSEEPCENG